MARMPRHLLALATLPALLAAAACGGSTTDPISGDRTALLQAESRWNSSGVRDYDYDLVTSFAASHDSVQVEVRNNQVTLSESYLTGQTSPAGTTIPDLFGSVDAAIVSGLKVQVIYDPQLGYPANGMISAQYNTPAGPSSWSIVHFVHL